MILRGATILGMIPVLQVRPETIPTTIFGWSDLFTPGQFKAAANSRLPGSPAAAKLTLMTNMMVRIWHQIVA